MKKGFISYKEGEIPFVIEDYRMELFTNDGLLDDFIKEYNHKENYILKGFFFNGGVTRRAATFYVEYSMGSTCYLRSYIKNMLSNEEQYDAIGFESYFLDDVFRYKYEYLETVRSGINLAIEPKDIYNIPFSMNNLDYELIFRIGHDNRLGLLENFDRKGETIVKLNLCNIEECYNIAVVLNRLAMFMTSREKTPFKNITLYNNGYKTGWFYFPYISEEAFFGFDSWFCEFDVMRYIPRILNNISLDSGNKITRSVPLGHLREFDSFLSPQQFIEQVVAFEYLFEKLEPKKAKDNKFPLKDELKYMFDKFPKLLSNNPNVTAEKISYDIKELRRNITHGYAYYYDFKNDSKARYIVIKLNELINNMSLLWIGFSMNDIDEYPTI